MVKDFLLQFVLRTPSFPQERSCLSHHQQLHIEKVIETRACICPNFYGYQKETTELVKYPHASHLNHRNRRIYYLARQLLLFFEHSFPVMPHMLLIAEGISIQLCIQRGLDRTNEARLSNTFLLGTPNVPRGSYFDD